VVGVSPPPPARAPAGGFFSQIFHKIFLTSFSKVVSHMWYQCRQTCDLPVGGLVISLGVGGVGGHVPSGTRTPSEGTASGSTPGASGVYTRGTTSRPTTSHPPYSHSPGIMSGKSGLSGNFGKFRKFREISKKRVSRGPPRDFF
jgi:hypothetical protein